MFRYKAYNEATDPPDQWSASMKHVHYRPVDGFFGDAIPFYWRGSYHVFYLKTTRKTGDRLIWSHIVSNDLVHWREMPDAILPGEKDTPDSGGCWTGSVIEKDGVFHAFYTGWNPNSRFPQTICHAVSSDLVNWVKDNRNPVLVPDERWYGEADWRDPFVFWNPEEKLFFMLVCATTRDGPVAKRGCVGLAKSRDLEKWDCYPPFYAPNICGPMECPDLFELGGRWYLVFSEFTENLQTHYRVSDDLKGPWRVATPDVFNGQRFYAAKTAGDGARRVLFGWVPTRENESDEGKWQWGGHLAIPHELKAEADGSLSVQCPGEVVNAFQFKNLDVDGSILGKLGEWKIQENSVHGKRTDGLAYATIPCLKNSFALKGVLSFQPGTRFFGLLIRTSVDFSSGYMLGFEPAGNRMVFSRFPRAGDAPPLAECPVFLKPGKPTPFLVFVEDSIVEAFIGRIALSCRAYGGRDEPAGFFVAEGAASYGEIRFAEL
ncbi:MAG: family 43 glycosylhydrolase [Crenarchaeota archaeon]|nr:family 43 glycosylhydrolase [Thermoproteota archaeon]